MCTAATYLGKNFYLGRNLDYEFGYGQKVLVTERNYPMHFNHMEDLDTHYAIIGMGVQMGCLPQYFDGVNEKGLAMAGLNFVGNAYFTEPIEGKDNLAQHELIPYILAKCASVKEVRKLLENLNIDNEPVLPTMQPASLHWIIGDKEDCITLEQTVTGIHVYDNKVGVLTNNPPFDYQMFNLNNYMGLSVKQPENNFAPELPLATYSRGMGALGLPGDLSSASRFVKVAYTRNNSKQLDSEMKEVSHFFHILSSVEQQYGCCEVKENEYEFTIYSSCMNCDKGIYYYNTYYNHQLNAVDMHKCDLDGKDIVSFEFIDTESVNELN